MLYAAYFHVDPDGSASGSFPDVPGCYFAGDTVQEAFEDAKSALDAHFELMTESGDDIPNPRPPEEHIVNNVSEYMDGRWLYVDIDIKKFMGTAERINVSLPHFLVKRIDDYVVQHPQVANRSAFLADAAIKVLQS